VRKTARLRANPCLRSPALLDDRPAPGLVPQPFEHESRPDAPHVSADCGSIVEGVDHDLLYGKARAGSKKSFQLPTLPQVLDTPEGGDHLLADLCADAVEKAFE
jgi:hypothetical protein